MAPMEGGQTAADLPVGNAPAPAVITDNVADQVFGSGRMQRARGILADEHGGKDPFAVLEYALDPDSTDDVLLVNLDVSGAVQSVTSAD